MEKEEPAAASSPPTKASLKSWWANFTRSKPARSQTAEAALPSSDGFPGPVFGVPLRESMRVANVSISKAGTKDGPVYIYGYVPVVVAKCGLYLKEYATEIEGTFRVNGSTKRMKELQTVFESADRKFGRNINWGKSTYTTHDVASVFRRYLTMMPQPVITHELYFEFREAYSPDPEKAEETVTKFQGLIKRMPRENQYLLLYVLDLLSVFARKSDKNLMTATNLAVIFRPGILSHPDQELAPKEHALSQKVLEFLIQQQDMFIRHIPPPPRTDSILVKPSKKAPADTPPTTTTASSSSTRLLMKETHGKGISLWRGKGKKSNPTLPMSMPAPEDIIMVPSDSDEEGLPKGGWRVVENKRSPGGEITAPASSESNLPTSIQGPDSQVPSSGATVKRSKTTPSKKSPSMRRGKIDDSSPPVAGGEKTAPGGRAVGSRSVDLRNDRKGSLPPTAS